jgi:phage terminase Nu1 subunit (DNA packaging protein)
MASMTQCAKHLFITRQWFAELVNRGVFERAPRGKYDLDAIRRQYIGHLKAEAAQKNTRVDGQNYSELLEYEKYREKKRLNDLEEKKYAPVSLLTDALLKAGNQIIPILESLPLIMKRHFPEITGDQIQMVKTAIAECRNTVADMELDLDD